MSKRAAEQAALKAYPPKMISGESTLDGKYDGNATPRYYYIKGYEQAEKDTIEMVCEWLEKNVTFIHPRKGVPTCIVNLSVLKEAILGEE